MSNDDDALGTALWLTAGGAAGYAAGRWLVAPALTKRTNAAMTSSSSSPTPPALVVPPKPLPRALAYGPSGPAMPIDPYSDPYSGPYAGALPMARGPSGDMQPIDPYADPPVPSAPLVMTAPSVTMPSVMTAPGAAPSTTNPPIIRSPRTQFPIEGPITMPSQVSTSATPTGPTAPNVSGPITRPSQTDVRPASYPTATGPKPQAPSGVFVTSARVRRFDPVFTRYRGSIPIEYVRALVERESDGQPSVRTGSAIGLMQVVPVVLADYNKRHGSAYGSEHLADPATNVAIGCELLRIIVTSYQKNHPRIRTLQPNWDDVEYVALVTLGWNAGYSEAGGLGRVARYLEGLGAVDITIDQVAAHAKHAGATKHLSNPAKVAWCKSVVALYQRERAPAFVASRLKGTAS